ncbi:MAG: hypothetical protein WBA10_10300 [Elainellaceae cyanobacterium]
MDLPLVYVVMEGDYKENSHRYIEASHGFEFLPCGEYYNVAFNEEALDPVSGCYGKCEPVEGGYHAWGPKDEDLGQFATLSDVCKALEPYTYALHYGRR